MCRWGPLSIARAAAKSGLRPTVDEMSASALDGALLSPGTDFRYEDLVEAMRTAAGARRHFRRLQSGGTNVLLGGHAAVCEMLEEAGAMCAGTPPPSSLGSIPTFSFLHAPGCMCGQRSRALFGCVWREVGPKPSSVHIWRVILYRFRGWWWICRSTSGIVRAVMSRVLIGVVPALTLLGVSSDAVRRAGPRLQLPARRAARHADGSQPPARPRPICSRSAGERELADVIFQFGEERILRRIARAIVDAAARSADRHDRTLAAIVAARRAAARLPAHRSGDAHVPGAAHLGQPRARRARRVPRDGGARGCAPARGWPSSRFTRSRTGSSSTRSARSQQRRRALRC